MLGIPQTSLVKSLNISDGRLVSFDVDSLFTKVPIDDVLEFLKENIKHQFKHAC